VGVVLHGVEEGGEQVRLNAPPVVFDPAAQRHGEPGRAG
jgi:hypothetical protein